MAEQRDLGLDPAGRGVAAEAVRRQHAVAGDQDRDAVAAAELADALGVDAEVFRKIAISPCFTVWNLDQRLQESGPQPGADPQRQVEIGPCPGEVFGQLG